MDSVLSIYVLMNSKYPSESVVIIPDRSEKLSVIMQSMHLITDQSRAQNTPPSRPPLLKKVVSLNTTVASLKSAHATPPFSFEKQRLKFESITSRLEFS